MKKVFTKRSSRIVSVLMTLVLTLSLAAAVHTYADDDVKPRKITRAGKATVTVKAGQEFELKVKTSPDDSDEDYLKWKIVSGSKYVKFDDDDRTDDEIELKAVKAGTAKIRCSIKGTNKKVNFTVKVKAADQKIKAVGKLKRTVYVGDDFELEVKKYSGLSDNKLKWSIKNTKIVGFDENDRTDDDLEFKAKKTGKTTITCTNKKTDQKITYTITVKKRASSSGNSGNTNSGNSNSGNSNSGNSNSGNSYSGSSGGSY